MKSKYYIGGSEKSAVTLSERQIRRQIEKYGIPKEVYVDNPTKISKSESRSLTTTAVKKVTSAPMRSITQSLKSSQATIT